MDGLTMRCDTCAAQAAQYAQRLGVLRDGMTKGQVAEAITCKLALDAVARKERTVGWL